MSQNYNRTVSIVLVAIIVFLLGVVAVSTKPALTGYAISKDFEDVGMSTSEFIKTLDSTKAQLTVTENNLNICKGLNQDYLDQLAVEKNMSFMCEQEKNEFESRLNQLRNDCTLSLSKSQTEFEQKKGEIETQLSQEKSKLNDLEAKYNALVQSAANNICCKAKVDNKEIDSYDVVNNAIVCTVGGEKKISCY